MTDSPELVQDGEGEPVDPGQDGGEPIDPSKDGGEPAS